MDAHALKVLEFDRIREKLAESCASELGRRVARGLEPGSDPAVIRLALRQTDEARALVDSGEPLPVQGLTDFVAILDRAREQGRPLEPQEFCEMSRTLERARHLASFLESRRTRLPELAALAAQFLDHSVLTESIDRTIEAPNQVRDGASEKLWDLRRAIRKLEDQIRFRLQAMVDDAALRPCLQQSGYTIKNGRFVLAVKLELRGKVPGILHDRSQSGATAFIEPTAVVPWTNELRELRHDERKEENAVLRALTREAQDQRSALLHSANLLAWFDFTAAKAQLSKRGGMRAPEASPDGGLRLAGARHPLLELTRGESGAAVVPIDVRLREGFDVLVITGPNTGGKTVTLKTVGLLQAMFQAGLHLPCDAGSRLPVFRDLAADIGDEQSIAQNLSTFSGHVQNIARLLQTADKRTLVLLDELGSGTDPAEGAALGVAILEELVRRRSAVVVTTHLGSLKEFALARKEVENASVEFDPVSLEPTYRLFIGIPGNSNALDIARRHGLPAAVIDRAREIVQSGGRAAEELIEGLVESRRSLEASRAQSDRHLVRSKNLEKAAEERLRHLENRARRVETEARQLIEETFRRVLSETGPMLNELSGAVPKALRPAVDGIEQALRSAFRASDPGRRRREHLATLGKQDLVFVPRLGQVCRITRIDRAAETLTVQMGQMGVSIPFDDVSWLDPGELRALLELDRSNRPETGGRGSV